MSRSASRHMHVHVCVCVFVRVCVSVCVSSCAFGSIGAWPTHACDIVVVGIGS